MKTIGQLVRSAIINYDGMHQQNRIRIEAEYGTEEYNEAGERRERYRKHLEEAIDSLKALGIDPEILI
jgi:hypothetical protein